MTATPMGGERDGDRVADPRVIRDPGREIVVGVDDITRTSALGRGAREAAPVVGLDDTVASSETSSPRMAAREGDDHAAPAMAEDARWLEVLTPGSSLGRLKILRVLGAGGMGIVYAAHDPELDREVAVKLIRRGRGGASAQLRLLREAQALAKLSHPNVVAVHDVGVCDGQVWISMEFVAGRTLGCWLEEARPPWRQILAVLKQAMRGVIAAHAEGLLHRDIKPDNIMLGDDGRVRVMDFGLARADVRRDPGLGPEDERSALHVELTAAGTILGTPGYMAPEQFLGLDADERSDQFALALTAWEALYGRRRRGAPSRSPPRRAVTFERVAALEGHDDAIEALAFAPAGARLATGSRDGTVRIWDAASGSQVAVVAAQLDGISSLEFSPDGAHVAVVSDDHKVTVWDAATGVRVAELRGRVSLRREDGSSLWPIPPRLLTRVGCQRLEAFAREVAEVAEICEPLRVGESTRGP